MLQVLGWVLPLDMIAKELTLLSDAVNVLVSVPLS